jgi:hypothetical protein
LKDDLHQLDEELSEDDGSSQSEEEMASVTVDLSFQKPPPDDQRQGVGQ